jgi:hypothetical protein
MGSFTSPIANIATTTLHAIPAVILNSFGGLFRMCGESYRKISSKVVKSRLDTISWIELQKAYLNQLGYNPTMRESSTRREEGNHSETTRMMEI